MLSTVDGVWAAGSGSLDGGSGLFVSTQTWYCRARCVGDLPVHLVARSRRFACFSWAKACRRVSTVDVGDGEYIVIEERYEVGTPVHDAVATKQCGEVARGVRIEVRSEYVLAGMGGRSDIPAGDAELAE